MSYFENKPVREGHMLKKDGPGMRQRKQIELDARSAWNLGMIEIKSNENSDCLGNIFDKVKIDRNRHHIACMRRLGGAYWPVSAATVERLLPKKQKQKEEFE